MSSEENGIRIVVFSGSVRPGNYTAKATALVVDELQKDEHVSVESIDPALLQLPLPGTDSGSAAMEELREKVSNAAGVILATPEYHGSFSSVMKLIIENLGFPSVLAGKPVALLGVAAGAIGAIKSLEQLRSVCSHIGAIVLPGPVSVAHVHKVFDDGGRCLDEATERRVRGAATSLLHYVRQSVCPRVALERMVREETL
ncbi:MAG: NADPH-dependent FMN reductase [Gemmatimonadales bacterium]